MKPQGAVPLEQQVMWARARWELEMFPGGPDPGPVWLGSTAPSAFTFSPLLAELGNIYLILPHARRHREQTQPVTRVRQHVSTGQSPRVGECETTSRHRPSEGRVPPCPTPVCGPRRPPVTQPPECPLVYKPLRINCALYFQSLSS